MHLLAVLVISQAAGLAGVAVVVAVGGHSMPSLADLWPAAVGGIAGMVALGAFYRGLAIGTMSIVAPISATGAAVPVFVGLATGDRPGALRDGGDRDRVRRGRVGGSRGRAGGLARGGRGADRVCCWRSWPRWASGRSSSGLDASADVDVWWALLAARAASFSMLCVAVAVVRPELPALAPDARLHRGDRGGGPRRERLLRRGDE